MERIIQRFDTEAEARAYRDEYYRKYPPEGYGTSLAICQEVTGRWSVTGFRGSSCD